MPWLAVDEDGDEIIFEEIPTRDFWNNRWCYGYGDDQNQSVCLPKGTIKKIIGKELTWVDEPFELAEQTNQD